MKLNPNATATIIISGLALCHRNKNNDTWESLFIRDEENFHNLKMKVGYGNTQEFEVAIAQGAEIAVKVTNPKSATDNYKPTAEFSRSYALNVINDSRWVLNFSSPELHNKRLKIEKRERETIFSILRMHFSTLSVYQASIIYYRKPKMTSRSAIPRRFRTSGNSLPAILNVRAAGRSR